MAERKPKRKGKGKAGGGVGQSIGSILVGFDQAVFRTLPPAEELVHHSRPDDPVPAGDAGEYLIHMPDRVDVESRAPRRHTKPSLTGE